MTACAKLTASASAPRRPSRTSRRQVNNWPADNPYLRAVADTSRGALALSATIRRFSSGVQRRRAPVWIPSSRDTFDIVVCSVIRLCLRGFIPQRKAAVAGGLRYSGLLIRHNKLWIVIENTDDPTARKEYFNQITELEKLLDRLSVSRCRRWPGHPDRS